MAHKVTPTTLLALVFVLVGFLGLVFPCAGETILDVVNNDPELSDLSNLINSSFPDIAALLSDTSGPSYTFFAPDNNAINQAQLTSSILYYHLVSQAVNSFTNGMLVPSMLALGSLNNATQRIKIAINGNNVFVNGNGKILENVTVANGVMYEINHVLGLPNTTTATVRATSGYSTLSHFITTTASAGLNVDTRPLTLFAPSDTAFSKLSNVLLSYLQTPNGSVDLSSILSHHIVANSIFYSTNFPLDTPTTTLHGDTITVSSPTTGTYVINTNANIVDINMLTSNGVFHGIDTVLLPNSFVFDLSKVLVGLNCSSFLSALSQAGLISLLTNASNEYTLFVPSEAAFSQNSANFTQLQSNSVNFRNYLLSFFVPGKIQAAGQYVSLTTTTTLSFQMTNGTWDLSMVGSPDVAVVQNGGQPYAGANGLVYIMNGMPGLANFLNAGATTTTGSSGGTTSPQPTDGADGGTGGSGGPSVLWGILLLGLGFFLVGIALFVARALYVYRKRHEYADIGENYPLRQDMRQERRYHDDDRRDRRYEDDDRRDRRHREDSREQLPQYRDQYPPREHSRRYSDHY